MSHLNPDTVIAEGVLREERAVCALEAIADALTMWAKIEAQRYDKEYPTRGEVKDATITRVASADDKLRESQGASNESQEEWEEIGPRERALLDQSKRDSERTAETAKKRSPRKTGREPEGT